MPKLPTTHRNCRQGDSEQPFDDILDFFVCGGRERPVQDSEADNEQIPLDEHPHDAKRSRQAAKSNTLRLFNPS
jgi:hypothetical protein